MDIEEDEETLKGKFNNDLYTLDPANLTWRKVDVVKKKSSGGKSKDVEMKDEEEVEEDKPVQTFSDGVFTVTVGGSSSAAKAKKEKATPLNGPSPRSHAGLAFSKGQLFVYAGLYEEDDRQYTLTDFYSLDAHKLDEWRTIIGCDLDKLEWLGSDSESDDSDDDEGDEEDDDDDDEDDDDSDEDDDDDSAMDTE